MPQSFQTEKGSIYTYGEYGRTTRYKAVTGEMHETQDVTVFARLSPDQEQDILHAIHKPREQDETKKVYVAERGENDEAWLVRRREQVRRLGRLYLIIYNKDNAEEIIPVSLEPEVGANVFDTRHYKDNSGQAMTERHLGNKVIKISE